MCTVPSDLSGWLPVQYEKNLLLPNGAFRRLKSLIFILIINIAQDDFSRNKLSSSLSEWLLVEQKVQFKKDNLLHIFQWSLGTVKNPLNEKHEKDTVYYWMGLATVVIYFLFSWFPFHMNYPGRFVFLDRNYVLNQLSESCSIQSTCGKIIQNRRDFGKKNYPYSPALYVHP